MIWGSVFYPRTTWNIWTLLIRGWGQRSSTPQANLSLFPIISSDCWHKREIREQKKWLIGEPFTELSIRWLRSLSQTTLFPLSFPLKNPHTHCLIMSQFSPNHHNLSFMASRSLTLPRCQSHLSLRWRVPFSPRYTANDVKFCATVVCFCKGFYLFLLWLMSLCFLEG